MNNDTRVTNTNEDMRAALEELLNCCLEPAGMTQEIINDKEKFSAMLAKCEDDMLKAIDKAKAALSAQSSKVEPVAGIDELKALEDIVRQTLAERWHSSFAHNWADRARDHYVGQMQKAIEAIDKARKSMKKAPKDHPPQATKQQSEPVMWRRRTKYGWEFRYSPPTAQTRGTGWMELFDRAQPTILPNITRQEWIKRFDQLGIDIGIRIPSAHVADYLLAELSQTKEGK
jgi:hypothetical protein